MFNSSRRHGKAVLGAAAMALLASTGVAHAAPPEFYGAYPDPSNPRTGTEVTFSSYVSDPESKAVQFAWDFTGGSAFGALSSSRTATHTFTTDGVHWISARAQDADGEHSDMRLLVATHPDNWNPVGSFDSNGFHANLLTESDEFSGGQYLSAYMWDPDSPQAGFGYAWDLDDDGDFNDGAGDGEPLVIGEETYPDQRIAHFQADGTHPVKVKFTDGQGGESIVSGTVRTHTANEAPFSVWGGDAREFDLATVAAGGAKVETSWDDDYSWDAISYAWKLGDAVQVGAVTRSFTLPSDLAPGTYQLQVTATDDGRGRGESSDTASGPALSRTLTIPVKVVEGYPAALYASGIEHGEDATFRTLENISLYASAASGQHPTGFAWDLDNDGHFDDATGYSTYFSAANKGTYRVAVRMTVPSGDPVTVSRDLVVDSGQDYAPGSSTGTGGGGTGGGGNIGTGGGTTPPVATPEQVKAAMATFLSAETVAFLQLVANANRKGIDAGKATLVLGTLGPDQLPNGGTGRFDVYDKAPKLARAAAAKKPKLLGTTRVTLAKGQSKKVQVKLDKKGKALLKKKGKVKLTVRATLTDALTGAQAVQLKSYTFKVKKKKSRK